MFRFFVFMWYPLYSKTFSSSWNLIPFGCLFIFSINLLMPGIYIPPFTRNTCLLSKTIIWYYIWYYLSIPFMKYFLYNNKRARIYLTLSLKCGYFIVHPQKPLHNLFSWGVVIVLPCYEDRIRTYFLLVMSQMRLPFLYSAI